jgi:photosystem II stability/assembly factor-like uncharacterized protein
VPSGFRASSFSATNARDWWLSGTIPCRSKHRCLALVRTLNGGHNFTRVPVPTLMDVAGNGVAQFRFADPRDGYLVGARFWSTSDGGRRWQLVKLGGEVGSAAVGGGFVYATVWNRTRGFLMRSPIGRDDWTVLAEGGPYFEGVTVDNGLVLADREVNAGGVQQILVSHDQGATFTASSPPLAETTCEPEEPSVGTVWLLCRGGMMDGLFRSSDGGLTFSPPHGPTAGSQNSSGLWPGSASLGAASVQTAVLGGQQLFRTTDGGRTFKRVPLPVAAGGWDVAFMNERQGLALGGFGQLACPAGRLYYTADGGASYHRVRF